MTLLSGVVFTSYVVAGIGAGTILLLNFMSPGVTKAMTGSAIGIAGVIVAGHAVDDRVRADPQDDEDRRLADADAPALRRADGALPRWSGWRRSRCCATPGPIERLGGRIGGAREHTERSSVTAKLVEAMAVRLGPRLAPSVRATRRTSLEHKLDYAGRPAGMTVQRFIGRKAALALLLGLGVGGLMLLLGAGWFLIPLLGAAGWFAPDVYLSRAGRLRQEAIERTLPDFLDILAVSVRAGLGYRYALRRVAESLGGPVGEEMLIVLRQIDLGQDRRDAFLALRERNESDSLKSFVAAQLQAEELGVPLSEALNDIASDMRRMANQNARRQAQRASPRVSLLVTTLIVPGSMILILLSIYFALTQRRRLQPPWRIGPRPAGGSRRRRRRRLARQRLPPDPQRPRGHPADHALLARRGGAPRAGGRGDPGRQHRVAGARSCAGSRSARSSCATRPTSPGSSCWRR